MKKIILFSFLLLNLGLVFGQDNPLKKYANAEGITSVVVTQKMLSIIPIDSFVKYEGLNLKDYLDKINSINIYTSTDKVAASKLLSFANDLMKTSSYEKLIEVNSEKVEKTDLYIKNKGNLISELIVIVKGGEDKNVVMQFMGDFTIEDIKQMTQ
ncbi:MAG: DUF4252 domain-containing protein [Dysgonamonadaceae bacterium]|jgi:hypothetical protein|nr:DUF4252 domain-containing protein [Dysgonamonadaceae bacterium]MDD3727580.1 DUF4252 domain-containing protein [Dysgonamonadaceae bacterium]